MGNAMCSAPLYVEARAKTRSAVVRIHRPLVKGRGAGRVCEYHVSVYADENIHSVWRAAYLLAAAQIHAIDDAITQAQHDGGNLDAQMAAALAAATALPNYEALLASFPAAAQYPAADKMARLVIASNMKPVLLQQLSIQVADIVAERALQSGLAAVEGGGAFPAPNWTPYCGPLCISPLVDTVVHVKRAVMIQHTINNLCNHVPYQFRVVAISKDRRQTQEVIMPHFIYCISLTPPPTPPSLSI